MSDRGLSTLDGLMPAAGLCEVCDQPGGVLVSMSGTLLHPPCAPTHWRKDLKAKDRFMESVRGWAVLRGGTFDI